MSRGQIIVVNNFEELSDFVVFSGTWMRKAEYLIHFLVWRQLETSGQVNFGISLGKEVENV